MFTACDARLSSLGRVHHWQGLTELWCMTYVWHDRKMYTKIQLKLVMILKLQIHKNALWSAFWLGVANHGYSAIFHALRLSSHARFFARVRNSHVLSLARGENVKMTSRFQPHPGDACTWVSRSRLLLRFWRRAQGARFIIRTTRSNRIWNSSQTWSFYRSQHLLCSHRRFRVQYLGRKGWILRRMLLLFQINSTSVGLFTKLRTMKRYVLPVFRLFWVTDSCLNNFWSFFFLPKLRLKIGLLADNFRVHCNICADKKIGVDMLMTSRSVLKYSYSLASDSLAI